MLYTTWPSKPLPTYKKPSHLQPPLSLLTKTWLITTQFLTQLLTYTYIHPHMKIHQRYTILLPPPNNSMQWILVTLRWWDSTTSYEDQHSFNNSSLSCWLSQNLSLLLEVCFDPIQILQLGRIAYHGILIITAFGIPTF